MPLRHSTAPSTPLLSLALSALWALRASYVELAARRRPVGHHALVLPGGGAPTHDIAMRCISAPSIAAVLDGLVVSLPKFWLQPMRWGWARPEPNGPEDREGWTQVHVAPTGDL